MTLTSTAQSDKYTKNKQQANITQNQQNQNQQPKLVSAYFISGRKTKETQTPRPPQRFARQRNEGALEAPVRVANPQYFQKIF